MAKVLGCSDGEVSCLVKSAPHAAAIPNKGAGRSAAATEVEFEELAGAPKARSTSGLQSTCQVLRRVWFLALLSAMFHVFMQLEIFIYIPYLYTRVHCCADGHGLDTRYDVSDSAQLANILAEASSAGLEVELSRQPDGGDVLRACSVPHLPPGSPLWSLSPSCANRAFVQDNAQGIMAKMKPLQKALSLAVLPVGGASSDALGRRPVLVAYVVLLFVASSLAALDTTFHAAWGDAAVYMSGLLLCASFQPKDAILASGVADVIGRDEAGKSRAFACLMVASTAAAVACALLSYCILRMHLTAYLAPWLGLVGLCVVMFLVLLVAPETLPDNLRRPLMPVMLNPLRTQISGMQLLARDPVLVQLSITSLLFWCFFLGFITTKVSYLVLIGFDIEETMLPGTLAVVIAFLVSAMLPTWLPRLGAWWSCILSFTLWCVSYVFWGPIAVLHGRVGAYVGDAVGSAAFAILLPSVQTIVSDRVEEDNQGKCQSALSAMGALGAIIGVPIYNHFLFRATAQGLHRAWPALTSLALALACLCISLRIAVLAKTTPAAISEERPPQSLELRGPEGDGL